MTPPAQPDIAPQPASPLPHSSPLCSRVRDRPADQMGWIRVTGEDRARWLNGMVTNSILHLGPGEGNYNFVLSVQGRIQGDATIFAHTEAFLMETASTPFRSSSPSSTASSSWTTWIHRHYRHAVGPAGRGPAGCFPPRADRSFRPNLPRSSRADHHPGPPTMSPSSMRTALLCLDSNSGLTLRPPSKLSGSSSERRRSTLRSREPRSLRLFEGTPLYGTDIRDRELRRKPHKPALSTLQRAATSGRRSSSASGRAAMYTEHSVRSVSKEIYPPQALTSKQTANRSASSPASQRFRSRETTAQSRSLVSATSAARH